MNDRKQQYFASTRPALLLTAVGNKVVQVERLEWHAFVNEGPAGGFSIAHLWGAPPTAVGSCQQETWIAPGTTPPPASGSPAAMLDPVGNIHVFFVHQENRRVWQIVKLAGGWGFTGYFWGSHDPESLPEAAGDPAALCTPDGTQHVFYRTTDNRIHHIWWDPSQRPDGSDGTFSQAPWGNIADAQGAPAALQDHDGVIHVYYRRPDKNIYQTVGTATRDHGRTAYGNFRNYHFYGPGAGAGDAAGDPSAVVTRSGRQCIFYRDTDNNVMLHTWTSPNNWESRQVLPEGLSLMGDPSATLLGGESALVLGSMSLASGEDVSVTFPCQVDANLIGDIASSWWSPWYNLPLPQEERTAAASQLKYQRLVKRLSQGDMKALLQDYSPLVWLYSLEAYRPSSVDFAFAHMKRFESSEYKHNGLPAYCVETKDWFIWPCYPEFFSGQDYQTGNGKKCVATCYAFLVDKIGPFTDLTYFFFYPFNFGTAALGDFGNHVGDWEYVTVRLEWIPAPGGWSTPRPWAVYRSAHEGKGEIRRWDSVEKSDGTHPVIYAAGGTHANYFEPGIHEQYHVVLDFCDHGTPWDTKGHLAPFYWNPDNPDPADQGNFELTALDPGKHVVPEWMKSNFYQNRGTGPDAPYAPDCGPIFRWGNEPNWLLRRTAGSPEGPIEKWEVWRAWSLG